MFFSHLLKRSALLGPLVLAAFSAGPSASAQCANCTPLSINDVPVSAKPVGATLTTVPASNNRGKYTVTVFNATGYPLPGSLPPGNYVGWCGTSASDPAASDVYVATTTPPATLLQSQGTSAVTSPLTSQTTWNRLNWVFNHKTGYTIAEVQVVVWKLMGT
jgi:hypothetical protein